MTADCHCSICSMTAVDSYCSCDRSIIHVLDLATPRFEIDVRQPPSPDCGKLPSKRLSRAYKSMTAVGETDVQVTNAAVRKRFTTSAETLHRSLADYGHHIPAQEQSSRSEVVPAVDRNSSATDRAQAPDFCTTDQLQEYNFCVTNVPQTANFCGTDFFAVITPNASDDFDAVDLTGDDYRQISVDFGDWEQRSPAVSTLTRSPENGTGGTRAQVVGVRKGKGSLWTRFKRCIGRRLCCQQW